MIVIHRFGGPAFVIYPGYTVAMLEVFPLPSGDGFGYLSIYLNLLFWFLTSVIQISLLFPEV